MKRRKHGRTVVDACADYFSQPLSHLVRTF
jgi:hypothetical protein